MMEHQTISMNQATPKSLLQKRAAMSFAAPHRVASLQQSIGNRAVQRLLRSPCIQAKLNVSSPGDPYEQEADQVADTVMRMPDRRAVAGVVVSSPSGQTLQRDLATPPPNVPAPAQPDLNPAQIQEAIAFNRARYNEANTRLIQTLLGGPVTGVWEEGNIEAIAATQEQYGLPKDGKVGNATFRFLNNEQRLERRPTSTENCLTSFQVIGPERAQFDRVSPTDCRVRGRFRTESQFSPRCGCAQFQYRQFIRGHLRRTRGGVVDDLADRFDTQPGGALPANFAKDGDTTDVPVHFRHRDEPADAAPEDHYINNAGGDDQANGCRYRSEDDPGGIIHDCQPGDRYDINVNFRGDIERNGTRVQSRFWTAIQRNNWTP
jgi:hypothetical protein